MSTPEHNSESAVATQDIAAEIESSDRPCLAFATNGSAEADAALRFASALASREELLLRILTVLEPLPALPVQPAGAQWQITIEMERAERILDRVRNELSLLGKRPSTLTCMLVGSPGATIADAAREWNAKYVIVGAGRHGAIERFFIGDTVVRVIRHAVSPVIAVPASCGALPRNGVVAVDFGETSLAAARTAAEVIGEGVLHMLHIRPEIDLPATDPSAWSDLYESGAQSLITKLATELKSLHPSVSTTTRILRGHVPTVLLDYADHVAADLIAVGQHGHAAVDRFLFGSVAQAVVHSAHCAVLVSPPAGK
jgi:nucleotide-binding universal stress UspA family protein